MPKIICELRVTIEGSNKTMGSRVLEDIDSLDQVDLKVPKAIAVDKRGKKSIRPTKSTYQLPKYSGNVRILMFFTDNYSGGKLEYGKARSMSTLTRPLILHGKQASQFVKKYSRGFILDNHALVDRTVTLLVGRDIKVVTKK